jgi:hypothetical protein
MNMKVAPGGLKPQECEKNSSMSRPPIPYIPKKKVIQEAIDSSANMLKLTLSHKVELCIPFLSKGTPEQFLVNVQQALDAISQNGHITAYEKAVKDKEDCIKKLTEATEALEKYTREDMNPPKEKVLQKATEAITQEDEVVEAITNQVFQLYSNLLTEEARRPG